MMGRWMGVVLVVLSVLGGCAQVGDGPPPSNIASANPDRFTFKIEVAGALSGQDTDERARKEIEFYRTHHGYNSYEVVTKTPDGSHVNYEVQFAR
ncbi:MAG: hypothetical protein IT492_12905 [Gammaproteobacteria bacterium]|nr:hypothetical protein [Gammaproteobacteria bacterium]